MSKFYRPAAPSDGVGNIHPDYKFDLKYEQKLYMQSWWEEEEKLYFAIGCCNFGSRIPTIYAVEAARLMCGANEKDALKLLKMAVEELEKM